jgi:hypothetical protein
MLVRRQHAEEIELAEIARLVPLRPTQRAADDLALRVSAT